MNRNTNSLILSFLDKKEELTKENLEYLMFKCNSRDYLTLNYMTKELIKTYGRAFFLNSENRIKIILQLLLQKNLEAFDHFYKKSFEEYMDITGYNFETINTFNLFFLAFFTYASKLKRLETEDIEEISLEISEEEDIHE